MNCPKCGKKSQGRSARVQEQSMIDLAMVQQRRRRRCFKCGHEWDTMEISSGELARLRGLAHRAIMEGK